jgi:hypothetical protein
MRSISFVLLIVSRSISFPGSFETGDDPRDDLPHCIGLDSVFTHGDLGVHVPIPVFTCRDPSVHAAISAFTWPRSQRSHAGDPGVHAPGPAVHGAAISAFTRARDPLQVLDPFKEPGPR